MPLGTSYVVTLPSAPVSGHLLLALVASNVYGVTPTVGWTQLANQAVQNAVQAFYRVAQPGDAASQTVATINQPVNGTTTYANYTAAIYDIANIGYAPIIVTSSGQSANPGDSFTVTATLPQQKLAFIVAADGQGNSQTISSTDSGFVFDSVQNFYHNEYMTGQGSSLNGFIGHSTTTYPASSVVSSTFTIAPSGEVEPIGGLLVLVATNVAAITRSYAPMETLTLMDVIVRNYSRAFTETNPVSDFIASPTTRPRNTQESLTFLDIVSDTLANRRSVSDTSLSFNDFVLTLASYHRALSELLSPSDSTVSKSMNVRSSQDIIVFSDAVSRIASLLRNVSDTPLSFNDFVLEVGSFRRNVSESLQPQDSATKRLILAFQEVLSWLDSASYTVPKVRSANETLPIAEALQKRVALSVLDSIAWFDAISKAASYSRNASDRFTLTEAISAFHKNASSQTELLNVADSISKRLILSFLDVLSTFDTVNAKARLNRSATDANLYFNDFVLTVNQAGRMVSELLAFSDVQSRVLQALRTTIDSVAFTDSATRQAMMNHSASDAQIPNDTVAKLERLMRAVADAQTPADLIQALAAHYETTSDTLPPSDFTTDLKMLVKIASDSLPSTDTESSLSKFIRAVQDAEPISDSVMHGKYNAQNLTDALPITDAVLRAIQAHQTLTTVNPVSDAIQRTLNALKASNDAIVFSDSVQSALPLMRYSSESLPVKDTLQKINAVSVHDSIRILDAVLGDFLFTSYAVYLIAQLPQPNFKADLQPELQFEADVINDLYLNAQLEESLVFMTPLLHQRGT